MKLLPVFIILLMFPVLLQAEGIIDSKINGNPQTDESNLPVSSLEIKVVDCAPMGDDGCFDWCVIKLSEVLNADKIQLIASNEDGITVYDVPEDLLFPMMDSYIDGININFDLQQMASNRYGGIMGKKYDCYKMLLQYNATRIDNTNNQKFIKSTSINQSICFGTACMYGDIIKIFFLDGRELLHEFFNGQRSLDLSSYPEGIYILNIQRNKTQLFRSKIILKH